MPFSVGPQNCAGKALAMLELRVIAACIVQKFDMKVSKRYDINQWEKDIKDMYVTVRGPLRVDLSLRK